MDSQDQAALTPESQEERAAPVQPEPAAQATCAPPPAYYAQPAPGYYAGMQPGAYPQPQYPPRRRAWLRAADPEAPRGLSHAFSARRALGLFSAILLILGGIAFIVLIIVTASQSMNAFLCVCFNIFIAALFFGFGLIAGHVRARHKAQK